MANESIFWKINEARSIILKLLSESVAKCKGQGNIYAYSKIFVCKTYVSLPIAMYQQTQLKVMPIVFLNRMNPCY